MADLDTPEGRAAYIEAHGPDAYNRAMAAHIAAQTDELGIRPVNTRFGRLFSCPDGVAFRTREQAVAHLKGGERQ